MTGSSPWRDLFYGTDTLMPTSEGLIPRSYLNNAATPQIAKPVIEDFLERLPYYAYDNETNAISRELREAYNEVREVVLQYIGGETERETVIYTPTTTTAINLMSHIMLQVDPSQVILTTRMEHMANYLPWRERFETALVETTPCGNLDMDDYRRKLERYGGRVKLVAVTGASNITGVIPPFYEMARLAHEYGARLFLDAVQLVQHKPFCMKPHDDPEHIDFLSFDGHKCYTGQSGGVLVGPKRFLDQWQPMIYGAGMTDFVSASRIVYRDAPERYEAGYPDFLGILSMGNALRFLKDAGICRIAKYESELYMRLMGKLREIPGMILYGVGDPACHAPFVAFNLEGMPYQTLALRLGDGYGIAVASGTSGANLYVQDLLGLTDSEAYALFRSGRNYGIVRASIGMFNSPGDVDRLACALKNIACSSYTNLKH
jgi:selenocysteine lyase/cysteine desulfurase